MLWAECSLRCDGGAISDGASAGAVGEARRPARNPAALCLAAPTARLSDGDGGRWVGGVGARGGERERIDFLEQGLLELLVAEGGRMDGLGNGGDREILMGQELT